VPLPATRVFVLWAFFGLAAATFELAVLAIRWLRASSFVLVDAQVVWMTPLSYLILTAPLAALAWLGSRLLPGLVGPRVVVFALALAGSFSVLFLAYPSLHSVAILLLAVGVAVQTSGVVARRPDGFAARAGLVAAVIAVAAAVGGIGVSLVDRLAERRAVAGLPAHVSGAPNILLLILDTVRASSLGLYGHERPTTPTLDRLAAEAVVFDQAFSTAPWTLTSHASLFTGRYPFELSASWTTALDETHPTLAEGLAARGYLTAGFVANLLYTGSETGLARGFQRYEDHRVSAAEIAISSSFGRIFISNPRIRRLLDYHDIPGRRTADEITGRFLSWVGVGHERPFFAFLNYYDAHEPYLPIEPFASRFSGGTPRQNHLIRQANVRSADRIAKDAMTEAERREEERAYEAGIAWIDAEVDRILEELEARGLLENTVVVVSSDHGEQFGEHGLFAHGGELYTQVLHVPLLISGPGVARGVRVGEAVSLVDLPATLLELARGSGPSAADAGLAPGPPGDRATGDATGGGTWVGGRSLIPLWGDPAASGSQSSVVATVEPARNQPAGLPSERGPMSSLVRYPWHYIRNGDGVEELYDLSTDPEETNDVALDPAHREVMIELRRALADASGDG
jgi:arylsulfatase A-like enzyme